MFDAGHAEQISECFGLGPAASLTGPVARGEVGQVWRLTTSRGVWAVKQPFKKPFVPEVDDDARFQDLVAAAGVPIPAVVRTGEGQVLIDLGSTCVRVYEWVDLLTADRHIDPATVGRVVAGIHQVEYVGDNGVHPWYTDAVGAARWDELVAGLVAADAPFASRLGEYRDELVALEGLLEASVTLQSCHRDLFADNVLGTPAGGVCVIDWENSGLADPSQELAMVLFEFSCGEADRTRTLYEAYCDAGGPGRIDRPGNFSMVIAQLGHIGEVSCRRWLDPERAAERDRNAGRVHEFLTEGITIGLVHDLLDAFSDA